MKDYKILGVEWRSAEVSIGFVAYDCQNPAVPGQWNSVVGIGSTNSEDTDAQHIAAYGAKIEWQIAQILFPQLDIRKHKYYTK